jgi:hypothetical protein
VLVVDTALDSCEIQHPLVCQSASRQTPGAMVAIGQLDALKKVALPGS